MTGHIRLILGVIIALSLGACAPKNEAKIREAVSLYYTGNFLAARQIMQPLADDPDEDFVLNNCRLGSIDLADYWPAGAEAAFLRAYELINAVGVNQGGRTLGAIVVDEKMKVWKGEPYERAMVNFYLGIIYYMRQDYQNARAAFENALFKLQEYDDVDKDNPTPRDSNFAAGYLMLAKSWQRLGRPDLAQANFDKVTALRSDLSALADYKLNEGANLLLVIDFGYGPTKETTFDGAIVGFGPKPAQEGPIPTPRVIMDNRAVAVHSIARPPFDLLALAQERKWQSIDTLRTIKSAVGTGLIAAGAVELSRGASGQGAAQRRDLIAGAALLGAGLLLKATSQADVRQWEMLPRTTFLLPLRLPPGTHDITVDFPATRGITQTWRGVIVPERGETTLYMRMLRWDAGTRNWPPPLLDTPLPSNGVQPKS